jgi:hypothetical protein
MMTSSGTPVTGVEGDFFLSLGFLEQSKKGIYFIQPLSKYQQ